MTKNRTHIFGARQTKIATPLGWVAIGVNSSQIRQLRLAAEHIGPECIQLGYGIVPRGLFDHFPLRILPWRRSPGTLMLQQQMWCPNLLRTHFFSAVYFLCHVLNHSLTKKTILLSATTKPQTYLLPAKTKSLLQQQHKQLFSLSLSISLLPRPSPSFCRHFFFSHFFLHLLSEFSSIVGYLNFVN